MVAAQHRAGVWRLVLVPVDGGDARVLAEASASRYDATFLPDGRSLVLVSERAGVPNIATLALDDPAGSLTSLTDVTGAALAPDPGPDGTIYFLRLTSRGFLLHRVDGGRQVAPTERPPLPGSVVVARGPLPADTFATRPIGPPRAYGLGPRGFRLLPGMQSAADSWGIVLSLGNFDPVGRFTVLAQGAVGSADAWRGGAVRAAYHGTPVSLGAELFGAGDRPSRQDEESIAPPDLDADYWGGTLSADWTMRATGSRSVVRVGGSAHRVEPRLGDGVSRVLSFIELRHARLQTPRTLAFTQMIGLEGTIGRTGDRGWQRIRASAALGVSSARFGVRGETEYARVSADAPAFERILVGGAPPLLFDDALLSQRIAMPAVPLGIVGGRQALTARVSLTGPVLEPFAWGAKGGEPLGDWYRVIGLETREITAPIPYARVPELRIRTGVVYTLDAPNRHRIQGYGSLVLRP